MPILIQKVACALIERFRQLLSWLPTPATPYNFRARATDTAGSLSAYSNIVESTTPTASGSSAAGAELPFTGGFGGGRYRLADGEGTFLFVGGGEVFNHGGCVRRLTASPTPIQYAASTMLAKPNLFLIGPMGSGKSAVGKLLSRMLDMPFYDSDTEIERRTGVDIAFIFEKEGETGFRQREREAIEALTAMDRIVLATGGGAVLLPENRRLLADRGRVVYLKTSVSQQADRVRQGRTRPLLSNVDPEQKLAELMSQREPLYVEIADVTVTTDNRRVRNVAEDLLRELEAALGAG
jgi:shikimate kinase